MAHEYDNTISHDVLTFNLLAEQNLLFILIQR